METAIGILLVIGVVFTALVLPWINFIRVNRLRTEMACQRALAHNQPARPIPNRAPAAPAAQQAASTSFASPSSPASIEADAATTPPSKPSRARRSFEEQFGQRLPVWIGAIALAFGGYFLVRYSIENLLVTPELRILSGMLLGGGLIYAGHTIRNLPRFADAQRIAQALSGAGIIILYLTVTAATRLYELLPLGAGFFGMVGITALAVVLSLRHGGPIALLGMVGGFLSPALIGSQDPSPLLLFVYLYLLFLGLMLVIRREGWWWLAVPTLIAAFAWVLAWMGTGLTPDESLWSGLFLIALSTTIATLTPAPAATHRFSLSRILHLAGIGGALLLSASVAGMAGFALADWAIFGALSLGSLALSWFRPTPYRHMPFAALALSLLMLSQWHAPSPALFALVAAGFMLLFAAGGYLLLRRAAQPLPFALLCGAALLTYFTLAYTMLHSTPWAQGSIPFIWGALALLLATAATTAAAEIRDHFAGRPEENALLAVFAATATALIALALGIELEREFFSVAIAGEMFALAWIARRLSLPALRPLVAALAVTFSFLLMPQLLLLAQLTVYSLSEVELALQQTVPLVAWPLFQLGLPAALFLATAWMLRRTQDGLLAQACEYSAIALAGLMGYYLMRHAFHVDENILFVKAGFMERGAVTNALLLYGLGCLALGRIAQRRTFTLGGVALASAGIFRILYFDMLLYNPAFAPQEVAGYVLLNGLLLPFGLPLLWMACTVQELRRAGLSAAARAVSACRLPLLFFLLTLNVRFLFHGGETMHSGVTGNAEIYAYSFLWLALGVGLLLAGTLRHDHLLRRTSLGVMLLAVCKVFLYDAAELEGLYRVCSFLGLGASLIGLSWFYTRFVFGTPHRHATPPAQPV